MKKKDLFVITSAIIAANDKIFSKEERFLQTIQTIESIGKFACNYDIAILEISEFQLPPEYIEVLYDLKVQVFYLYESPRILHNYLICKNQDEDMHMLKNLNELAALEIFWEWLSDRKSEIEKYGRIFKLSGRYCLNENFDQNVHHIAKDKMVFLKSCPSYLIRENSSMGLSYAYMCRLWSIDMGLFDKMGIWLEIMNHALVACLQDGYYIDSEHLYALIVPEKYISFCSIIGVEGLVCHPDAQNRLYE